MIKPTIGRVVWFRPGRHDMVNIANHIQPMDAHIVYVHSDALVNIAGWDHKGQPFCKTSVRLRQEGEAIPEGESYVEWMPYQQGQAKRHETEKDAAT